MQSVAIKEMQVMAPTIVERATQNVEEQLNEQPKKMSRFARMKMEQDH
jgi:hypothetical protein